MVGLCRLMTAKEKLIAKQKLGLVLQKIISDQKQGITKGGITSLRKLAAASDIEFSIIQLISSGKKDPQFTTLLVLAESFELSISEFLSQFEKVNAKVIRDKKN